MRHIVCSSTSGIASTPTPLSALQHLPIPIADPEARVIITNHLQTDASDRNQRQRQLQLHPQAVSTLWSVVSGSRSINWFGHWDRTRLQFATGRLLELYMWSRPLSMRASNFEMVCYAMWRIAKALTEAPRWQMIEKYWNTAMEQDNVWSIAFEACTTGILKEVWWSNGRRWI